MVIEMRLRVNTNKDGSKNLYVIQSYRDSSGKSTTKIIEKLGTYAELKKLYSDPIVWAKQHIEELNAQNEEERRIISVDFNPSIQLALNGKRLYNGGYLYLQKIYYDLKLDYICRKISAKYKFDYNLNDILRTMIFGRILFPASKLSTFEQCQNLIEPPTFELHDIYRSLEVIADETNFIQSELYKHSKRLCKRNDKILYYDCTNYFFEIEHESGMRQYGVSKEHRPNPLVQMGLFIDGDGIPLAFDISSGNTNEQKTLIPVEKQIIEDFGNAKFVVCTDAGLSSHANRKFNSIGNRAYITSQSVKKMKAHIRQWCLAPDNWKIKGSRSTFNIGEIMSDEALKEKYYDTLFFKEQWVKENGLEERIIVSFSIKYAEYMKKIRSEQISRAIKAIQNRTVDKARETDCKRFIKRTAVTKGGEIAEEKSYMLDTDRIHDEELYDGIYAVATNLEDPIEAIIAVNKGRWEIEESFRIMKTEFKARPVYLSRDKRIKAHFTTCFIALVIFRYLEKKLGNKYSCRQIIEGLQEMSFLLVDSDGYIPVYTRNSFTDDLHACFPFRTDKQIILKKAMKKIISQSKTGERTT